MTSLCNSILYSGKVWGEFGKSSMICQTKKYLQLITYWLI